MISPLIRNQAFLNEDGKLTERSLVWTQNVSDLQILTGAGSPEGFVEAGQVRLYMDTAGTAGSIVYIKRDTDISGDRKKGWILV